MLGWKRVGIWLMKLYFDVPCSGFQPITTSLVPSATLKWDSGVDQVFPPKDGGQTMHAAHAWIVKGYLSRWYFIKLDAFSILGNQLQNFAPCRWKCSSEQSWSCKRSSQFRHIPFCRALEAQNFDRTLLAKNLARAYLLAFCILVWDSVYWAISVISLKWLKT